MKKKYYFSIAVSITIATLMLTGCEQPKAEKNSTYNTPTANSPIATNSIVESPINYTEKLKSEGYSSESIESIEAAQSYISRIMLQLNEIETFSRIAIEPATIGSYNTEDLAKYSELLSKFDEAKAVYYLVKLGSDFNNLEDALNEYMAALQSDIDIDIYFKNKEQYLSSKNEKVSGTNADKFISVRDIEEKALEALQNVNNSNKNINQLPPNPNQELSPNVVNPKPNVPTVEIPKPIDPSREIREKLAPKY